MNLVINAKDAMPDGGEVMVFAKNVELDEALSKNNSMEKGQYVCLTVTDTGMGMSQEVLENAIDPFFSTKPPELGTGLGLSMAHGFAQQSNGYLRIESAENIGTTVFLYLPKSNLSTSMPQFVSDDLTMLLGINVLVVEDDENLRLSIEALVESLGCSVSSLSTAKEALRASDWSAIDVLLTDISMIEMSGIELAERALEKNSTLRVIYMSGYSDNLAPVNKDLTPEALLLQKPFHRAELSQALSKVITNFPSTAN